MHYSLTNYNYTAGTAGCVRKEDFDTFAVKSGIL